MRPSLLATDRQLAQQSCYAATAEPGATFPSLHGLAPTGMAGRLVAEAMTGDASRFDVFARLRHRSFPGGRLLRTPALVLGMAGARLRDMLGQSRS